LKSTCVLGPWRDAVAAPSVVPAALYFDHLSAKVPVTSPPPSWHPHRVLIAGRPGRLLADRLAERHPTLDFRIRKLDEVSAEDLAWTDTYVGLRPPVDGSLSALRWVHSLAAGVEPFLVEGGVGPETLLTRTIGRFGERIGEYCVARALARTQRLLELHDAQRKHTWYRVEPSLLADTEALVIGTGQVGRGIARAFAGLGATVRGVSRTGAQRAPFVEVYPVGRLARVVGAAHWLVVAVPLTAETEGLVGRDVLGACRGAYLINVARGRIIVESALFDALDAGRLSGAALDVFVQEPLPADSPFWDRPEVTISPHIAAITSVEEAADAFSASLEAITRGEHPGASVDQRRGY